jgi:hypothetical protein
LILTNITNNAHGGGGRFLSYNNEYNGWYHMTDPEQIYLKVEYICRELRFEMKKNNSKKIKLELELALALESSSASNTNTNTNTDTDNKTSSSSIQKRTKSPSTTTNMQTINSSTSIFQFQQHGNSEWGSDNTCIPSAINICTSGSKRQKTDFSSINNNNDCNDDDNNINNNNNQNMH